MSSFQGRFVWYELMTTDMSAAQTFYSHVVGWGAQDSGVPGMAYTLFTAGAEQAAGLMNIPDEARKMGAGPCWTGYVAVDDVDAVAAHVKQLGGSVHRPPADIPNVGRFAIVADPQGAGFALFKPTNPTQDQPAAMDAPGRTGWHELTAQNWEQVFPFYNQLFGWQKADAIDMGGNGTYQLVSLDGPPLGAMFTKFPDMGAPGWLYYFNVGDIDAAGTRVTEGGGKVLNGPMAVPGDRWILQCADPQGAAFALLGKKV